MDYDIAIIGAGPAGLSFALSLRDSGLKIAIIEKQAASQLAEPLPDGRDIALTHLSRGIMQQQGTWQRIGDENIAPILRAEVVDGDSPYTLSFDPPAKEGDPLGFLVANHHIRRAIYEEFCEIKNVTLLDECEVARVSSDDQGAQIELTDGRVMTTELMVAADTRFSQTRRMMGISADSHDFGRTAIVCRIEHELSHDNVARECFHYGRTLALLPMPGNTASVVITLPSQQTSEVMEMSEEAFNLDMEQRLQGKLGKIRQAGERFPYPLVAVHANRFYANRFALIGDAAVGMHPVTAHGFNLGLSGQSILAEEILNALAKGREYWSSALLRRYQRKHMLATRPIFHGTNQIVSLFTNDSLSAKLVRKATIHLSNHLPPVKWAIQHKLMTKKQMHSLLPLPPLPRLPLPKLPSLKRSSDDVIKPNIG